MGARGRAVGRPFGTPRARVADATSGTMRRKSYSARGRSLARSCSSASSRATRRIFKVAFRRACGADLGRLTFGRRSRSEGRLPDECREAFPP